MQLSFFTISESPTFKLYKQRKAVNRFLYFRGSKHRIFGIFSCKTCLFHRLQKLWNKLPVYLRSAETVSSFKSGLHKYLCTVAHKGTFIIFLYIYLFNCLLLFLLSFKCNSNFYLISYFIPCQAFWTVLYLNDAIWIKKIYILHMSRQNYLSPTWLMIHLINWLTVSAVQ